MGVGTRGDCQIRGHQPGKLEGKHCGAEGLAELLRAGLEPGTRENSFAFRTDWLGAE